MRAEINLSHKGLLVLGLFVCLGFSVSWNPDYHQVGTRDMSSYSAERKIAAEPERLIDLKAVLSAASVGVAKPSTQNETLHSFDLEKIDPNQKGLKVSYEIDATGAEKKVRYYVEGTTPDTCSDCLGLGEVFSEPLKEENIQNIEMLNRIIGKMAISKVTRKKTEETAKPETKKKETVTSACVAEDEVKYSAEDLALLNMSGVSGADDTVLQCKAEEYQALAEECQTTFDVSTEGMERAELKQALTDRKACARKLALYYNKFLKKDLAQGLSAKVSSQQNANAAQFRDAILRSTPAALTGIKNEVLKVSQAGLLDRSKAYYTAQMAAKGPNVTAQTIANQTKYNMLMEIQSAQGAAFCSAYSGIEADQCMAANTNPALRAALSQQNSGYNTFNKEFLAPIEKFASATSNSSGDPGFDTFIAQMNLNSVSETGVAVDPNLNNNTMPVPEGFFGARTNVQGRGGNQNLLLPLPGQTQAPGSVITPNSATGQVLLPLSQTQGVPVAPAINPAAATRPSIVYPTTQGQMNPRTLPAPVAPVAPTAQPIYQPGLQPNIFPTTSNAIRR